MQRSNLMAILCAAVLVAGCNTGDRDRAADDTVHMDAGAGQVSSVSLADFAGRWSMQAIPESGADRSPTNYTLTATTDREGWTITFPNRDPVPLRIVAVSGDSVVTEAGPYASARRGGVQVTTRTSFHLEGDRIEGWTRARYDTAGPDTVLTLRTEGTRIP